MFHSMMSKKTKIQESGFTLIENLLATVVVSIGVWGGALLMQNATAVTMSSDHYIVASQIANEKVEQIVADRKFSGYGHVTEDQYPDEQMTDSFSGYKRTVTVIEVSSSDLTTEQPGSDLKRVDVKVSWGDSDDQSIIVTTLIGNYS